MSRFRFLAYRSKFYSTSLSSIPDSIAADIQRKCQPIFPLQEVHIRKVKVLKKPKFDGKSSHDDKEL